MYLSTKYSCPALIRRKFPISKSKAPTATPFSSSSTILIVESSSSMPSTPDAPDCGSRSREMYNVAMVFERFF